MYGYMAWPGTYSFKEEISLLLKYFKEQIDEVMKNKKISMDDYVLDKHQMPSVKKI